MKAEGLSPRSVWVLIAGPVLSVAGLFVVTSSPPVRAERRASFTHLDTGTFTRSEFPVPCPSPTPPGGNVTCYDFTVSNCTGALPLGGKIEIAQKLTEGNPKGTISFYKGGNGTQFYGDITHINFFRQNGYRTIRVRWDFPWQDGDAPGESLKLAGCRPATVISWVKTRYGANPTCAVGISGGASQIAVSLAHYNAETMLTYAQLETGPPHAKIDEGCDPWNSFGRAPMSPPCPQANFPNPPFIGVPYDYSLESYFPSPSPHPTPNLNDGTFAKMDDYHGITGPDCGQPSPMHLATFAEGSIISSSGWDNNYPIPVDMYICSNGINGAGVGGLWFGKLQDPASRLRTKCYGDGSATAPPGPGESWCWLESIKMDEAALQDLKTSMLDCCAASPGPTCQ